MDYKKLTRVVDSRIKDALEESMEKAFDALFDKYVPASGKADTVGGEILRAMARIAYRFYNDGDKVGEGYGNITCNGSDRFLDEHCDGYISMFGYSTASDDKYERVLKRNIQNVIDLLNGNGDLFKQTNEEDSRVVTPEDEQMEKDWYRENEGDYYEDTDESYEDEDESYDEE